MVVDNRNNRKKKAKRALHKIGKRAAFYTPKDDVDTVVFVHGLRGHFQKTWAGFPQLLADDPDLPSLDIVLWGYPTAALLPLANDTQTEGKHLVATLGAQIASDNTVHLVGHSMGGLIILEGLVHEMQGSRAQQHPAKSISFISLYASPVSGSTAGTIAKHTLGNAWLFGRIVNKHIRSLARGVDCDRLLTETYNRIYNPDQEDSGNREIPIRMIMGSRDSAVTDSDRKAGNARFRKHQPMELDFGHSQIKEPDSRFDDRYRALANDLQEGFAKRFQSICQNLSAPDAQVRDTAEFEFTKRYERLLLRRFADAGKDLVRHRSDWQTFVNIVVRDGTTLGRPPFDTATRAMIMISGRSFTPQ